MNSDEFETRLSRQPLKEIPGDWRTEILAAARDAQPARHPSRITHRSLLSTLHHQLSTLLWPHPKAWAGLAAVWILIFVLNFSMREATPVLAQRSAPPSPEVMVQLKKQQRMFAELVGADAASDVDRPKIFLPKPRSGRMEILAV